MPSWISLNRYITALLVLALSCLSVLANAQIIGAPNIYNYDGNVYKARSQNWTSIQDQRGVLFFGNSSGLVEFDGQRWKTVLTNGKPTVRALAIASDQTIYYGSIGDFGYLATNQNGKVHAISLLEKIPEAERNFNDVWQIETTSHGIYFLTRSQIFRFFQGQVTVLNGKLASSQAVVINDHLLYVDKERGLSFIDDGNIIPIPALSQVADGKRIILTRFSQHQILAGRVSGGFLLLDLSSLWDEKTKKYRLRQVDTISEIVQKFPTEIDSFTTEENLFIYRMIPVGEQLFAVSTIKGGIILLDRQGQVQRVINRNSGLADNTVAGIMLDRSNNLWASTNSGISHIELSVPQSVFSVRNGVDGVSLSNYYHQGKFYVGSFQNILVESPFKYDLKNDMPRFDVVPNSPGEVWQFEEVAGDLMIASSRGLFRLRDEKIERIAGSSEGGYTLGTSPRWPNHVFMGKMDGLELFQRDKDDWKFVGKIPQIRESIRRITTDASGDLWLSTEVQGLIRLHFAGDDPQQIKIHRIGKNQGLPELTLNRAKFIDDTLFVATAMGLFSTQIAAWNDTTEATKFTPDSRFGTQFSNGSIAVTTVDKDPQGNFLLQTSIGVKFFNKDQSGKYQNNSHAFRGIATTDKPLFFHPNGSIWITGESLFRVDLDTNKDFTTAFSTLVRKVAANTNEVIFDGSYSTNNARLPQAETVFLTDQTSTQIPTLAYKKNALMFEFAASFYEKPGTTLFQYQLEGFDKNWSEWSVVNSKEYTNIPEGQYRFRVKAKNIYGTLANEASYQFTILAPWYRSYWAYLLWFVLASTTLWGLIHLYTLRLRANKKTLEQEVIARTREAFMQKESADEARHKIALLAEMGRQITASLETRAIQKSLYTYVQELIKGNTFGIGIVDWEGGVICFDFVIENGKPVRPYRRSLEAKEQPATQCVLSEKELLINNLTLDTRELDSFLSIDVGSKKIIQEDGSASPLPRSAIYVPIMIKNKVMGVIAVQNDDIDTYNENDITILRSLGSYAAVAFDNANSYHRLQLTQSKLVEQEKLAALGSLVAGVAHELNTPIGNSLLTASSLEEMTDQMVAEIQSGNIRRSSIDKFGVQAKAACTLLMRNLANAANLVTSFKQIAVDQTSDKRRVFNLHTVTSEVAATLGGRMRREEHQLSIQIPDNIDMDSFPGPYGQVITNLILNALIHAFDGKKNGEIHITAERINELQVRLIVSDNGVGINENNLNRIFEPFFTTRMGQGGSGLGLHISYNIVTAILGGSIQVNSRVNRGTSFEITLPLTTPEAVLDESEKPI
jgi:signal transduction histidine kinase